MPVEKLNARQEAIAQSLGNMRAARTIYRRCMNNPAVPDRIRYHLGVLMTDLQTVENELWAALRADIKRSFTKDT
jgi:hypothetical protein